MKLPRLDVPTTILLLQAYVAKERRGAAWCRKRIEPLREMAKMPPENVNILGSAPCPQIFAETRAVLAMHCKACGGCDLKDAPP